MTQIYLRLKAPAGRRPEILEALGAIRLPAQLDRGCASTRLVVDPQDPDAVEYTEDWVNAEGLERRVASDDFTAVLSVLECASQPPTVEFRDVTGVRGLEFIEELRRERHESAPSGAGG